MKASQTHYPSLFSSILFILGALFLFGVGLLMGLATLAALFGGTQIEAAQTVLLIAFVFEAIVLCAAAFFSFQKFLQKSWVDQPVSLSVSNGGLLILIVAASISLLLGYWISQIKTIDWIFLPVLTIPAIVFPLGALLAIASRKLPFGTRWQTWNVLGLSMTLAPLILFALEIFLALIIFAVVVAYVLTQPDLSLELQNISRQILILGPESEETRQLLAPYLTKPGVMILALIYIAILVPATEEFFKPIGVWLLAGQLDSSAQGLTLGALNGAGYALVETIGVSTQTGDWASLLFSRIGTGLLHITTSALMGTAIVLAWRERRVLQLIGTYLLAILLHGLWNSLAIFFTFSTLAEAFNQAGRLSTIQPVMISAMAVLTIVLFMILVLSNRRMRKATSVSLTEPEVSSRDIEIDKTI